MKKLIAFALSSYLFTATLTAGQGYHVDFPQVPSFPEHQYLEFIQSDIQHTQNHKNCIAHHNTTGTPSTALIVGAGTIAIEAIVTTTRLLPEDSTIIVIQNDIDDPQKLAELLCREVDRGDRYHWIVSNRLEIGELQEVDKFLGKHKSRLEKTQWYFHTADRAERFVPDALPHEAVIAQVVRRASVVHINNYLESIVDIDTPLHKIVISSECAQNRDHYKIPNLGPYQVGKIVGDELFVQGVHRDNSFAAILYSGPMDTQGQVKARTQEYDLLHARGKMDTASAAEEYVQNHRKAVDIDPMDSVGAMLYEFCKAYREGVLSFGKKYRCYGASVNPELGHQANKIELIEETGFMWPPLEG